MGGRYVNVGDEFQRVLKSTVSLALDGLIVKHGSTGLELCTASDVPYAVAKVSTMNRAEFGLTGKKSYLTGEPVPLIRSGWVDLNVVDNNTAIAIGDELIATDGGKVNKYTPHTVVTTSSASIGTSIVSLQNERKRIVGIAEEAVVAGTSTTPGKATVKAALTIRGDSP